MFGNTVSLNRADLWSKVPADYQVRIERGVERIAAAQDAIARSAKVQTMPHIAVDPALWINPQRTGFVHAAANGWPAGAGHLIGVVAAASVALCEDDESVRALLAHEFAHCFMIATSMVKHIEAAKQGPLNLTGDPSDAAREE